MAFSEGCSIGPPQGLVSPSAVSPGLIFLPDEPGCLPVWAVDMAVPTSQQQRFQQLQQQQVQFQQQQQKLQQQRQKAQLQQQQQQQWQLQQQQKEQQQRSPSYAALWNLEPSTDEQEVKEALATIGFNPEHLSKLGDGFFGLAFGAKHLALTFSVALDGIDPTKCVLKSRKHGVRAAPWPEPQDWLGPWNIPKDLVGPLEEFVKTVIKD